MSPIHLEMPNGPTSFARLVLDYTGTLSLDGEVIPGVAERLMRLAADLRVTILTADTFGTVEKAMKEVAGLSIAVVSPEGAAAGLLGPADIVTRDILDALGLIADPLRLKATLRD